MNLGSMATSGQSSFSVHVFDTVAEAEAVWREFEKTSDHYVFQTYDWLSHWHKYIGIHERVASQIVLLSDTESRPLALLPLAIREKMSIKRLVWLGGQESDYHGPLLAKDFSSRVNRESFKKMWDEVLKSLPRFDIIFFEKQPNIISDQPNPFVTLKCTPYTEIAYFTRLGDDWQAYYQAKRSRKTRKRLRNYENRLCKYGELTFDVLSDSNDIRAAATQLIALKRRRFSETGVRDSFKEPGREEFYKNALLELPISEKVKIGILRINFEIIAATLFIIYKGRSYDIFPAFNTDKFGKYSPGMVLLVKNMEWCVGKNIVIYDFTIGDDQYKEEWCEETIPLFYFISSRTPKGWYLVSYQRLRDRLSGIAWLRNAVRAARRLSL